MFINIKLNSIIYFKVVKNTKPQQCTFSYFSLTSRIDEDSSIVSSALPEPFPHFPHILHNEEIWQKLVYMFLFNNANEDIVVEWTSGR